MRNLFWISLILVSPAALAASKCDRWAEIAKKIEPDAFFKAARNKEIPIEVDSFEQARNLAQEFPALDELGISFSDTSQMKPFRVNMEKSPLFDQVAGWEIRTPDGKLARYRLDYSPDGGAHINLEVFNVQDPNGPGKNWYKAAIKFQCQGRPCSADEVKKLAESNFATHR